MVLMPRDPEWLYVYWDVPASRLVDVAAELGADVADLRLALRVYDVTDAVANAAEPPLDAENRISETDVTPNDDHWYIKGGRPEAAYCVEYVALGPNGRAAMVVLSNVASTPTDRVAPQTSERWIQPGVSGLEPAPPPEADGEATWEDLPESVRDSPGSSANVP
jgi:hypothetical protein